MEYSNSHFPVHRRAYRRIRVDAPATILRAGNRKEAVLLKDLCARGGGIISSEPFSAAERLGIVIKAYFLGMPEYREATVVWSRKGNDNLWYGGIDFGLDNMIELP